MRQTSKKSYKCVLGMIDFVGIINKLDIIYKHVPCTYQKFEFHFFAEQKQTA